MDTQCSAANNSASPKIFFQPTPRPADMSTIAGAHKRSWVSLLAGMYSWLRDSSWLCSLPLFLLLLITSIDFLILTNVTDATRSLFYEELPVPYNDERRDDAEILKTTVLQYVYIALLLICVLQWRKITGYFIKWPHLVILCAYLLVGIFISTDPVKVFTNSILILVGILASVLFALKHSESGDYIAFYKVVFWPILVIHVASLFILTLYDVHVLEFLSTTNRYGGLAGNPNSLGSTAVLGIWSAVGMLLSTSSSFRLRLISVSGLFVFFLTTALSGSGTSSVAILLTLLALFWLRILAYFRPSARLVMNGTLLVIGLFTVLYMFIMTTPAEFFLAVVGSLGKDATLSGRLELWAIAREAISARPLFGWGFDSHNSVMQLQAFFSPLNHYHNGYMDTLVAGGVILFALVIYNLIRFLQLFLAKFRLDSNVFPLLLPLIILLVLNISEYSLLRPNSQLWQVYLVAFAMLAYDPNAQIRLKFKLGAKGRRGIGRRKKGDRLRWA